MGTPDFAAASLKKLIEEKMAPAAVFTQPDRPRGRGMALGFSPVKELALANGIPVFQPEKLRDGAVLEQLRALEPEVLAVVAYGKLLPEELLALPKFGAVNVHGSLLPRYRGAAPIQRAVLDGARTTGVSTMYLAKEMDSGDIIYQEETAIGEFETSGELFDRLKDLGAALLVRTLRDIGSGTAPRRPQDPSLATYAPPLDKSLSPIDWNRSPRQIVKQIAGLQPWPVATMELEGKLCRVFAAAYTQNRSVKAPGTVISAGAEGIEIVCGGGETLRVTQLQAPGKKRMSAADYLRGHSVRIEG